MWGHWSRCVEAALKKTQATYRSSDEEEQVPDSGEFVQPPIFRSSQPPEFRLQKDDPTFMTDQTALNVALYRDLENFARLPAWCNWLCHRALPIIGEDGDFLEAGYPFRRIGILHLTAETKNGEFELTVDGGGARVTSLRCPWVETGAT